MSRGIIIIGSGFAARQLVKNIRKQDAPCAVNPDCGGQHG